MKENSFYFISVVSSELFTLELKHVILKPVKRVQSEVTTIALRWFMKNKIYCETEQKESAIRRLHITSSAAHTDEGKVPVARYESYYATSILEIKFLAAIHLEFVFDSRHSALSPPPSFSLTLSLSLSISLHCTTLTADVMCDVVVMIYELNPLRDCVCAA